MIIQKLNPKENGPFHIIKKINDNVYQIDLPGTSHILITFNVANLLYIMG